MLRLNLQFTLEIFHRFRLMIEQQQITHQIGAIRLLRRFAPSNTSACLIASVVSFLPREDRSLSS